jgi:hypothetical protein
VLFSNARIARIINEGFEPVWQSVRPVPIVTIDFGNGQKIKRTLHGNIATYVCTSSGHVVDVLPGLYTADTYEKRLLALIIEARKAPKSKPEFAKWLANQQVKRKQAGPNKKKNAADRKIRRDKSKSIVIEFPMIWTLGTPTKVHQPSKDVVDSLKSSGQLDIWKAMIEDTRINDTVRRKQISEFLAKSGPVFPESMTKWLYRDVLDSDIDDPWLGLKDLADASVFSSVEVSSSTRLATSK